MKIPKNLAAVADLYKQTRDKRLAMEKAAEVVKKEEKTLHDYIIDNLPKSKAGGIAGKIARVEIVEKTVAIFDSEDEDARDKFFKFAHRKGNEDLVTETINAAAVKERWEAGKTVPGVLKYKVKKLSLHAVKQKAR